MIYPSPLEEHLGQTWDPTQNEGGIAQANIVVSEFLDAMASNRVPSVTLDDIRIAADTLGTFAGYPIDAANMDMFLTSRKAASYRAVEPVLRCYVADMNALIQSRIAAIRFAASLPLKPPTDADLPF